MKQNIKIVRGTSFPFNITVKDNNGDAVTLADGEKIIFGVKKRPEHDECVLKKVITEISDGGVCTVKLLPSDTEGLPCGKYFYDVGLLSREDYIPVIACEDWKMQEFHIMPNITSRGDGE